MSVIYPFDYTFASFTGSPLEARPDESRGKVFARQGGRFRSVVLTISFIVGGVGSVFTLREVGADSLVFLVLGALTVFLWIMTMNLGMRLWYRLEGPYYDTPRLRLHPSPLVFGELCDLRIAMRAQRDIQITGGRVELIRREAVCYSCGTDICYDTDDLVVDASEVEPARLVTGLEFVHRATFNVPLDGPQTFITRNNRIGWIVRLTLYAEELREYERLFQVTVERQIDTDEGAISDVSE